MLYHELGRLFPGKGYFVEAGAHDGVGDSTTKRLEDEGWDGLCVEPSSAYHGLTLSRRCRTDNRCLGSRDGEGVIFREVSGEAIELSGISSCFYDSWDRDTRPHADREVKTVGMTTLLAEHRAPPRIEFLSLDTEGSEVEILKHHDFDRFLFLSVLVEHNRVESRKKELLELLVPLGYSLRYDEGNDFFLVHGDRR